MLLLIPRHPRKTTVREIRDRLGTDGFETTVRTIQRDLLELSGSQFPIQYDDRSKPYGWSWAKDAMPFYLPSLSVGEAMVLQMIEEHLRGLLPASALETLAPYFRTAEKRIEAALGRKRHQWLDMVRVVPPAQQLLPPDVNASARAEVYEALLGGRQVQIRYLPRGKKEAVKYDVNPLGVVQRGPVTYLVATIFKYTDIRLLALHRIKSAIRLDRKAQRPPGFDLDTYAREGHLDFGAGKRIKLRLRFYDGAGDHLHETPLSSDQRIEDLGNGTIAVTATVPQTSQLEWWIQAFLDGVEVLEPKSLRASMRKRMRHALAFYKSPRNAATTSP
jgi:predicted DNA-binding transcriptional regulator YafY